MGQLGLPGPMGPGSPSCPIPRSSAVVAATGPGDRAIVLPGHLPDAASLIALADRDTPLCWSSVCADPGLLFFLLGRHVPIVVEADPMVGDADRRAAAAMIADDAAVWADWGNPAIRLVVRTSLAAAKFATLVAD